MAGLWKHPLSGLSRDETGHMASKAPRLGANGIQMQTAQGAWGGPLLVGLPWGF